MVVFSGKAKLAGVLGWPVGHSLSPRLHGYWLNHYEIDGAYVPLPAHPDYLSQIMDTLPKLGFRGLNITVPYKVKILSYVDSIDDMARRIGAVNTVVFDEAGQSFGTNTDGFGFIENILHDFPDHDFGAGPAVVLGAGGAARAICVALIDAGVPEIRLSNRTMERAQALANNIPGPFTIVDWNDRSQALDGAALVINTTTLGMVDHPPLDIDLSALTREALVTDIVYAPLKTEFLVQAVKRRIKVVDGIGMLLHQARPGFESWFDYAPIVTSKLRNFVLEGIG